MTATIMQTSHLGLRASDLARSQRFYEEALGFCVLDTDAKGRVFLGLDSGDTEPVLILEQTPDQDVPKPAVHPAPYVGMEHFAFEIEQPEFSALQAAYRQLLKAGAEIHHCIDHRVTKSIYFLDPDSNLIEIYINAPPEEYADHMDHPYDSLDDLESRLAGDSA